MIKEKVKTEIREWAESIIIALILALLIRTFVIQAFKIPSGSMIPTFEIGDRIFVSKFIYGAKIPFTDIRLPALRQPKRGDIIVFVSPETPKKDFVKRLIAVEGETVEIKSGNILINGEKIDGPDSVKSNYYYNRGDFGKELTAVTVPKGFYFALGDNSVFLYWPIQRIRIIR